METIGDRIKAKRKELGLTQLVLAEKLNVTDRAVSKWEQNEGNPDFSLLPELANQLGVSLDYLITGKIVEPVLNLDDMDASKRAIYLAQKDDAVNFKKYGYVSDTIFLSPLFRNEVRRYCGITMPQYEDDVCKIIFEGKKKKIFKVLLDAFLSPQSKIMQMNLPSHASAQAILGEHYDDFIAMCILAGRTSGLEFVDFKYSSGIALDSFIGQDISDSVIDYISQFEFIKSVYKDGRTEYVASNIHDNVINFLYMTRRFVKLKEVIDSLYTNLEKVAEKYKPQNNDIYRTVTFEGTYVVENINNGNKDRYILGVVPRIHEALDSAIKNYDYEWIEIFNNYHKAISNIFYSSRKGFLTDEDLQALKLHQAGTLSKYEYISLDNTRLGLLKYHSILLSENPDIETEKNVDILKKCIKYAKDIYENVIVGGFIHYMELVETLIKAKDYRKLFEFSCNYNLQQLTDVVLEKNDEKILQTARMLFLPPEPYYSQLMNLKNELNACGGSSWQQKRHITESMTRCKNDYYIWIDQNLPAIHDLIDWQSSIIPLEEYCFVSGPFADYCKKLKRKYYISFISKVEEKIESITKENELRAEYDKATTELTNEYFSNLLARKETELFIIKLCSLLDVIFKFKCRIPGEDFHARMQAYFDNGPKSRDMDDGWGYMVPDTEWEEKEVKPWNARRDLFNRLRIQRNNVAHGEKTKVQELTAAELQECMNYVFSLQK